MSRYRDDDFYGGGGGRYERPRGDTGKREEVEDSSRGDNYVRGSRSRYDNYGRERDDEVTPDSRRGRTRDEEDNRRGAGFDERDSYVASRSGGMRRDVDDDYQGRGRGERYDREDEDRERSVFDEGRDYLRRTFGGSRSSSGDRPRGASRSHVRCRDIMTRDVTVATRDTTLQQVAAMMRDEDTGVIPVVDLDHTPLIASDAKPEETPRVNNLMRSNGKLVGLITDRDIVVRAIADGKSSTARAEEIMTTDVHTAQPNDRVIDAIRKMGDKQVRRIPIVDRDHALRGIISMADVALETEEDRELADALEEISSGSSFWNRVFG